MTEDAMGPPPAKSSTSIPTDSLPKTSDETSATPTLPTDISDPPGPEIQPELGENGLVTKPAEIHVSPPVDNANLMESKIIEEDGVDRIKEQSSNSKNAVPYSIPPWSGPPCHDYSLEVLKDGAIVNQFNINKKGAYMFGRVDLCDFVLEHPTVSRFHAVIQFKSSGDAYLYDVGSTHGTSINKKQVKARAYVDLHVGDVIRFGQSSRLYIFQGPTDLMPPEVDLKSLRNAKMRLEMRDMEASLQRAKLGAALSEGISWGLQEDAEEEAEDDDEEITWQTYKGLLTEKQEKTREKVLKRLEKIAHMKKEIDAIRAKDIAQGGLTQGQQTQIARNEQRISQILEELENLEETLNDSIRESIGARAGGTSRGGKQGNAEDGEDYMSDDDEFYDRTKKPLKRGEGQSIETADTLLDKQEAIVTEMEDIKKLLMGEDGTEQENEVPNAGDALDAYMSTLSSELASKKKDKLQKELDGLQSELDRVSYLLKIADPSGEAARRRALKEKPTENFMTISSSAAIKEPKTEQSQSRKPEKQVNCSQRPVVTPKSSIDKLSNVDATSVSSQKLKVTEVKSDSTPGESESASYAAVKTQWLGAVDDTEKQDGILKPLSDVQDSDQFVDYKDRKQILEKQVVSQMSETSEIESAAPGLIIRKRKPVENLENGEVGPSEQSKEAELQAEDAVALLLKHSRGYGASDEDLSHDIESAPARSHKRERKKPKKKLGPERPSFLKPETDYETWVPPEGQSGDGRTSLNDRYGY